VNVLTWFGAVLRTNVARNRIAQDPIWMTKLDGLDFEVTGDAAQTPLGNLRMLPGVRPNTVRFAAGKQWLTAAPTHHELTLDYEESQAIQTFLLIRPDDLADLRHILSRKWRLQPGRMILEKADIRLTQGFGLNLGNILIDLSANLPLASDVRAARLRGGAYVPPASFRVQPGDDFAEYIELAEGATTAPASASHGSASHGSASHGSASHAVAAEIELAPRRRDPTTEVAYEQTLVGVPNARIVLADRANPHMAPPLVISRYDRNLVIDALEHMEATSNRDENGLQIRREHSRHVCLGRGAEGLVFDREGTCTDIATVKAAELLPAGLRRRNGALWLDRGVLDTAPRLSGTHIVFYDTRLDNFDYWLAGAIPALDILSRNAPRNYRLLLPSGLTRIRSATMLFDHREVMAVLGFGQVPVAESQAPIVLVDDLVYMDKPTPGALPAQLVCEFRDRVLQRFDGRGEASRRIYLRPAKGGGDRTEMERFLLQQGFEPINLDHIPMMRQVELFRTAAFVVGSQGAGLSNIMFSPPGLRVLELGERGHFHPDNWLLATKLGHLHGYLSCTEAGVDAGSFSALFATMDAFRL
jgi:hypothetical protein